MVLIAGGPQWLTFVPRAALSGRGRSGGADRLRSCPAPRGSRLQSPPVPCPAPGWPPAVPAFERRSGSSSFALVPAPRDCTFQAHCFCASAPRSSSETRASMSSISIALAAWPKMASAARTRTDAGVAGSIMVVSSVVAAASRSPRPCQAVLVDV